MDDQKNDGPIHPSAQRHQRREALEFAIKAGGATSQLVAVAMKFDTYLRDGTNVEKPRETPLQPPLPFHFANAAADLSDDTLHAVQQVLRERARQVVKGYDANHDDEHTSEQMADQAAAAILGGSRFINGGDPFKGWIDCQQERTTVLVQGIALALAELERVHRAKGREIAADLGKYRSAPERADLAAAIPGSVNQLREAEGLPPLKPDDTWTQAANAIYAPIGELRGNTADVIVTDGLDATPKPEPMTMEALAVGYSAAGPAQEVEPMTLQDFGKMHHALGNPRDPQAETYRNHYAANREGVPFYRLRMFPKFWEEDKGQSGMAFFSVTDAGRAALAKAMTDNPEHFRIDVENGPTPEKGK